MGYILDLRKVVGSRPLILTGAGVLLVNEKGEVLLQKRRDNGFWDIPAGSMELGESFEECARREVFEESGLVCGELELFVTRSGKETFYEYPNGDQGYVAGLIYLCRDFSGEMKVQEEEVTEQAFFSFDALPEGIPAGKQAILEKLRKRLESEKK